MKMMFDDEEENNRDDFTCISILCRDYFLYSFFFPLKSSKRDPFLCVFDKHATEADAGG